MVQRKSYRAWGTWSTPLGTVSSAQRCSAALLICLGVAPTGPCRALAIVAVSSEGIGSKLWWQLRHHLYWCMEHRAWECMAAFTLPPQRAHMGQCPAESWGRATCLTLVGRAVKVELLPGRAPGIQLQFRHCRGRTIAPLGPQGRLLSHKGLFSRLRFTKIGSIMFLDLLGNCPSFLLSCFSLLEWKCLPCVCPTIVFCKHIIAGSHGFTDREEFTLG